MAEPTRVSISSTKLLTKKIGREKERKKEKKKNFFFHSADLDEKKECVHIMKITNPHNNLISV